MSELSETPKDAARRLAASAISDGYKPEALHVYNNVQGEPLFWRIRLKHPVTGEKWIRPMRQQEHKYVLGEPEFQQGKPLYNLPDVGARIAEAVYICEGEKCADALQHLGILATTSGSADSAEKTDWQPLVGRNIVIWPDNDDAGLRYATTVARILHNLNCSVRIEVCSHF